MPTSGFPTQVRIQARILECRILINARKPQRALLRSISTAPNAKRSANRSGAAAINIGMEIPAFLFHQLLPRRRPAGAGAGAGAGQGQRLLPEVIIRETRPRAPDSHTAAGTAAALDTASSTRESHASSSILNI